MRWLNLLVASVGIVASGSALALPQPDAETAYARGDYKTAFMLWLPLAEQGSARAQMNVAHMYEKGEYVAQDQAMALEWYRKAAEQSVRDNDAAPATANAAPNQQTTQQAVSTVPPAVVNGSNAQGSVQPASARPVYQPTYQPVYVPILVRRRPPPPPGAPFVHWHRH
jgi:hypothetical protein